MLNPSCFCFAALFLSYGVLVFKHWSIISLFCCHLLDTPTTLSLSLSYPHHNPQTYILYNLLMFCTCSILSTDFLHTFKSYLNPLLCIYNRLVQVQKHRDLLWQTENLVGHCHARSRLVKKYNSDRKTIESNVLSKLSDLHQQLAKVCGRFRYNGQLSREHLSYSSSVLYL